MNTDAVSASTSQHVAVPVSAITWILHNNCGCNVQLAILSNVCQQWREVCRNVLVAEAISFAGFTANDVNTGKYDATDATENVLNEPITPSNLRGLILTDMARELIVRQDRQTSKESEHFIHNTDGNFCLAWFAPSGIQITSVPLDFDENSDDRDDGSEKFELMDDRKISMSTVTEGDVGFTWSEINGEPLNQQRSEKKNVRRIRRSVQTISCCHEWRGYRHATEILIPFGFTTHFVSGVFDLASKLAFDSISLSRKYSPLTEQKSTNDKRALMRSASDMSQARLSRVSSLHYNPTFSVRGATLARSEGYCLCLDDDYIRFAQTETIDSSIHRVTERFDVWLNKLHQNLTSQRQSSLVYESSGGHQGPGLTLRQRAKKRSTIARALLPRIVMSTKRKTPMLYRFTEVCSDENKGQRNPTIHDPHSVDGEISQLCYPWERRQRAIQFLNCDKSFAVKLITPSFHCGRIGAPVTMFLVAISTEDGCFVSGRNSRFEFGHMYPLCSRDMIADMSPICIATGDQSAQDREQLEVAEANLSDNDDSCNSDLPVHCRCTFGSCNPFCTNDFSIEDPTEDFIHRGVIGPGQWRCYVAIFDGASSTIRVDGREEPQRTRKHYGLFSDNSYNDGHFVGNGFIDGLSIGSDHHFDMSLCYGEINGECGQGAISELAVFKGKMGLSDIRVLENYLMTKHGILPVQEQMDFIAGRNVMKKTPLRFGNHWDEDEWTRQTHAMMVQHPPWDLENKTIPLRVAACHKSVAWKREDEITGMPLKVSRIGHKTGNGSSDW